MPSLGRRGLIPSWFPLNLQVSITLFACLLKILSEAHNRYSMIRVRDVCWADMCGAQLDVVLGQPAVQSKLAREQPVWRGTNVHKLITLTNPSINLNSLKIVEFKRS